MEKATSFFDEKEGMPLEEREGYFNDRLRWIVEHAYKNAPAMRDKMDRAGVTPSQIRTIKDLENIPITSKEELRDMQRANPPFGGLLTVPVQSLRRICLSTGPIYDAFESAASYLSRGLAKAYYTGGVRRGDLVLNTFPYHMIPSGVSVDEAIGIIGATVIPAGPRNTELQVQLMRELGVNAYVGVPDFLAILVKKTEEMGYDFRRDFAMCKAVIAGQKYDPSVRKELDEDYGIAISEFYGTPEMMLAYECGEGNGMHIPEELILEIVDHNTGRQLGPGEVGEVVVTPFNEAYPLIRFGTGDFSLYTDEPCPCGRTSPRLVGIAGRVGEAVRVRSLFIHPKEAEGVFSRFAEVSRSQLVITRSGTRDGIACKVELREDVVDKGQLSGEIKKTFREICRLGIDDVEFVSQGTIPEGAKTIVDERKWG